MSTKPGQLQACDDDDCVGSGFDRVDFTYDGEGHRTSIVETPAAGSPIVTTTFRYRGDAVVAEYVGGTLTREYITDDAGSIQKVIVPSGGSAGTYLVTWNGHGDAMALHRMETNGTLTLANSYTYSTWGTPTTATHNSIADLGFRFLYVGAADVQWDDQFGLGLTYMHARHYSPALGRFLQPDPSRLDTQLFVYGGNGPVSKVDPAGTIAIAVAFFIVAAVWVVGSLAYTQTHSTAVWLQQHPITLNVMPPVLEWGRTFERRQLDKLRRLRPTRWFQPFVSFPTSLGRRVLDVCEYHSVYHYLAASLRPIRCYEFKSTQDSGWAYMNNSTQYAQDVEIMRTYKFPILLVYARCQVRSNAVKCY